MSGAGRKHRAKHLTSQFLDDTAWTELRENEVIAICIAAPQNKHVKSLIFVRQDEQQQEQSQEQQQQESSNVHKSHMVDGVCYGVREHLVYLPGKFQKVMWLSVKDVLVVKDLAVVLKPSPKQLSTFYTHHPSWEAVLKGIIATVDGMRSAPEKTPQYAKLVNTTTSVLPDMSSQNAGSKSLQTDAEEGQSSAVQQAQHSSQPEEEGNQDESEEDDGLPDLAVNPNRNNIKHRHQFFYYAEEENEDDEDDEEDDGDDEDEDNEEEEK